MRIVDPKRPLSIYEEQYGDKMLLMPMVMEALLHKVWLYNKLNV